MPTGQWFRLELTSGAGQSMYGVFYRSPEVPDNRLFCIDCHGYWEWDDQTPRWADVVTMQRPPTGSVTWKTFTNKALGDLPERRTRLVDLLPNPSWTSRLIWRYACSGPPGDSLFRDVQTGAVGVLPGPGDVILPPILNRSLDLTVRELEHRRGAPLIPVVLEDVAAFVKHDGYGSIWLNLGQYMAQRWVRETVVDWEQVADILVDAGRLARRPASIEEELVWVP